MNKSFERKNVIKSAIDATADESGIVTPDGVISAARNPKNPLHDEFQWDDAAAAHQHRLAIARSLIREVRYVSMDTTERVVKEIKYVHDPRVTRKQAYIPLQPAAKDRQLALDIVLKELDRCLSAIERARKVSEILSVECELDQIIQAIGDLQSQLREPPPKKRSKSRSAAELRPQA